MVCGPDCKCGGVETLEDGASFRAEQPEGWHACLKQKTRCVIEVQDLTEDNGFFGGKYQYFEATNSCHVEDADICPRVTAGAKSGEGYDLCGPPNHAEQEAAKLLLQRYPEGTSRIGPAVAKLYGHTYLCAECQHALTAAGVKTFLVTGQPA